MATVISATHIPRIENIETHFLTRGGIALHKWELNRMYIQPIFEAWWTPEVDVFATRLNVKYQLFCSREGVDSESLGDRLLLQWREDSFTSFSHPVNPTDDCQDQRGEPWWPRQYSPASYSSPRARSTPPPPQNSLLVTEGRVVLHHNALHLKMTIWHINLK